MQKTDSSAPVKLLYSLKDTAEMLSMTRQTVMNYVSKGELQCVRLARNTVWFRPSDLDEFIEASLERRTPLKIAS